MVAEEGDLEDMDAEASMVEDEVEAAWAVEMAAMVAVEMAAMVVVAKTSPLLPGALLNA